MHACQPAPLMGQEPTRPTGGGCALLGVFVLFARKSDRRSLALSSTPPIGASRSGPPTSLEKEEVASLLKIIPAIGPTARSP